MDAPFKEFSDMEEIPLPLPSGEVHLKYSALFDSAVKACAEAHTRFTVDDVWPFIEGEDDGLRRKAMGSAIRRAASDGLIVATETYTQSRQARCHGNPRRVWASLVYRGQS